MRKRAYLFWGLCFSTISFAVAHAQEEKHIGKNFSAIFTLEEIKRPDDKPSAFTLNEQLEGMLRKNGALDDMTVPARGEYGAALVDESHDRGKLFETFSHHDIDMGIFDTDARQANLVALIFAAQQNGGSIESPFVKVKTEGTLVTVSQPARTKDSKPVNDEDGNPIFRVTFRQVLRDTELFELAASQAMYDPAELIDEYSASVEKTEGKAVVDKYGFNTPNLPEGVEESPASIARRARGYLQYSANVLGLSVEGFAALLTSRFDEVFGVAESDRMKALNRGRVFGLMNFIENEERKELIGANNTF